MPDRDSENYQPNEVQQLNNIWPTTIEQDPTTSVCSVFGQSLSEFDLFGTTQRETLSPA